MKSGNEYDEALKASDLDRRATKTNWATYNKDGKMLLDCTNIEEEAAKDEIAAFRITQ